MPLYSFDTWPTTAARTDNYSVGYKFTVSSNITVSQLGRLYVVGNSLDHVIKIWDTADTGTPLVSATILAASASDGNNFKWVSISDLNLVTTKTYVISIDESGVDTWTDIYVPDLSADFTCVNAMYGTTGSYPSNDWTAGNTFTTPAMAYVLTATIHHSKEAAASLPGTNADLTTAFDATDNAAIVTAGDSLFADQTAVSQYAIFEFKEDVTGKYAVVLTWTGQNDLGNTVSRPTVLEVYKFSTTTWVELDRDSATGADTNFTLTFDLNLTSTPTFNECVDGDEVISWRVYVHAE